jgi:glucose-6-phosphate isomerase
METNRWDEFCSHLWHNEDLGMSIDFSQMPDDRPLVAKMQPAIDRAFAEMQDLEGGEIANIDEQRQVGHYWLRAPERSPLPKIREEIESAIKQIERFASAIHQGIITPPQAERFSQVLLIGIGGSALGPQWLYDAVRHDHTPMQMHFIDNTDPDGIDRVIGDIGDKLKETLVIITSKSGGTQETTNGMIEVAAAFYARELQFGRQAVAITGTNSKLYQFAEQNDLLDIFPIWDWVGGRTSLFSAVGLLPAALLGCDIRALLTGAADMDRATRTSNPLSNPAMRLALNWHQATVGCGEKAMVLLPYKDRLGLFSRYIQQLVMESLGKELDRQGQVVQQGLTVYGNKGSTDQHAFVQQLREGRNDFFVTFIEVLLDRAGYSLELEQHITSGDHLLGFLLGTRQALSDNQRMNLTISLRDLSLPRIGMLVALFERTVGFYASLIDINAYHQPGVEAGKIAAKQYIQRQQQILQILQTNQGQFFTAYDLAQHLNVPHQCDAIFYILEHLVANQRIQHDGQAITHRKYFCG